MRSVRQVSGSPILAQLVCLVATALAANGQAPSAEFHPDVLALDADDFEGQHAGVLDLVRHGDLANSLALLQSIAVRAPEPEKGHAAQDVERVKALELLRARLIEVLVQSGAKWTLDWGGKKTATTLTGLDGGELVLGENHLGLARAPIAALTPAQALELAEKLPDFGAIDPVSRSFTLFIGGEPKWDKGLKDTDERGKRLHADGASWLGDLVRLAPVAARLSELAQRRPPASAAEGDEIFAKIKELFAHGHQDKRLLRRFDALRSFARLALMRTITDGKLRALLHGTIKTDGDSWKINYEFSSQAELEDFVSTPDYLAERRATLEPILTLPKDSSASVVGGDLVLAGTLTLRHLLILSAPCSLVLDLRFEKPRFTEQRPVYFVEHMCDDAQGSYAALWNFGGLDVNHLSSYFEKIVNPRNGERVRPEKDYHLELRFDGATFTSFVDGEKVAEVASTVPAEGQVVLYLHSDSVAHVRRLEIKGKSGPRMLDGLRERMVLKLLSDLRFP